MEQFVFGNYSTNNRSLEFQGQLGGRSSGSEFQEHTSLTPPIPGSRGAFMKNQSEWHVAWMQLILTWLYWLGEYNSVCSKPHRLWALVWVTSSSFGFHLASIRLPFGITELREAERKEISRLLGQKKFAFEWKKNCEQPDWASKASVCQLNASEANVSKANSLKASPLKASKAATGQRLCDAFWLTECNRKELEIPNVWWYESILERPLNSSSLPYRPVTWFKSLEVLSA